MSDDELPTHLNNHHRDTLVSLFQHPASHNIDWKAVVSLMDVVGSVEEMSDGKIRAVIGGEQIVITRPRGKDIDVQVVVDLRRLLTQAGYAPVAHDAIDKGKEV